jgi:hypothetical protein
MKKANAKQLKAILLEADKYKKADVGCLTLSIDDIKGLLKNDKSDLLKILILSKRNHPTVVLIHPTTTKCKTGEFSGTGVKDEKNEMCYSVLNRSELNDVRAALDPICPPICG